MSDDLKKSQCRPRTADFSIPFPISRESLAFSAYPAKLLSQSASTSSGFILIAMGTFHACFLTSEPMPDRIDCWSQVFILCDSLHCGTLESRHTTFIPNAVWLSNPVQYSRRSRAAARDRVRAEMPAQLCIDAYFVAKAMSWHLGSRPARTGLPRPGEGASESTARPSETRAICNGSGAAPTRRANQAGRTISSPARAPDSGYDRARLRTMSTSASKRKAKELPGPDGLPSTRSSCVERPCRTGRRRGL